jgi:hypothetical protein
MFSKFLSKLTQKKVKQTQTAGVKRIPKVEKAEAEVPDTKVQDQSPVAQHVTFTELPNVVRKHKHQVEIPPRSSSLRHSGMPIQGRHPTPNRKEKYPTGPSVAMMTPIIPPRSSSRVALRASRARNSDSEELIATTIRTFISTNMEGQSRWSSQTTHTFRDRNSGAITSCAIPLDEEAPPRAHRPGAPHAPGSTIFTTYVLSTIAGKEEWISRTTYTLADGTSGNQCSSSMPLEFFPAELVNPAPPRGPTQPVPRSSASSPRPDRRETTSRRRAEPFATQTRSSAHMSAAPRSQRHGAARPGNGSGRDAKPQGLPAVPPKSHQPTLRRTPAFHRSPEQFPYIIAQSRVGSLASGPRADSIPSQPLKHKQH